jgi:ABC-type lipoprotein export system ATPase subunit
MESMPILKLIEVSKWYEGAPGVGAVEVLRQVSFEVGRGDSLAIIGPSGSGKSTLLNLIGTLDRPSAGQVLLEGRDLSQLEEGELAAVRHRHIGCVFQAHHLLPHCTVLENVLVPVLAAKEAGGRGAAEGRARQLLEQVGLDARMHHRPGQLSGGERQRVAVVRALINQPQLLLADEPTGSLDRAGAEGLGQLLVDLNRERGVTLIVVTHALELARRMARVWELREGRLKEVGRDA